MKLSWRDKEDKSHCLVDLPAGPLIVIVYKGTSVPWPFSKIFKTKWQVVIGSTGPYRTPFKLISKDLSREEGKESARMYLLNR